MYGRMLDKAHEPTPDEIIHYLGPESTERMSRFEAFLGKHYELTKSLCFPFGNSYGWGNKYGHKSKHLCYLFFEEGSFTVTVQLGDKLVNEVERKLNGFLPKTQELWANRYPCGERGGWVHYRVLSGAELDDVMEFVQIKCKPFKSA